MQFDAAWFDKGVQRLNDRAHFHAVVGGVRIAARNFFFMLAITDDRTPAARPGVALARAVGENFNLFHGNWANKAST